MDAKGLLQTAFEADPARNSYMYEIASGLRYPAVLALVERLSFEREAMIFERDACLETITNLRAKLAAAEQLNRQCICVYCGDTQTIEPDEDRRDGLLRIMKAHLPTCEKHPLNRLAASEESKRLMREALLSVTPLLDVRPEFREVFIPKLNGGMAVCLSCGGFDDQIMIREHRSDCESKAQFTAQENLRVLIDAALKERDAEAHP